MEPYKAKLLPIPYKLDCQAKRDKMKPNGEFLMKSHY